MAKPRRPESEKELRITEINSPGAMLPVAPGSLVAGRGLGITWEDVEVEVQVELREDVDELAVDEADVVEDMAMDVVGVTDVAVND